MNFAFLAMGKFLYAIVGSENAIEAEMHRRVSAYFIIVSLVEIFRDKMFRSIIRTNLK